MNPVLYQAVIAYIVGNAGKYQFHTQLAKEACDFAEALRNEMDSRYKDVPPAGLGEQSQRGDEEK